MARRGGTQAQKNAVTQRRKGGLHFNFDIGGKKQLIKNLNRLKLNYARNVVRNALEQGAKRIIKPAIDANIATVSPGRFGTGKLKTLGTEVHRTGRKAATKKSDPKSVSWRVSTPSRAALGIKARRGEKEPAYYPAILEVGGKASGFFPVHYIEGQHMLKRARDQKNARFRIFLRRTIKKFTDAEIKRIWGKSAKKDGKFGPVQPGGRTSSRSPFRSFRQRVSFKRRGIL